MTTTHRIGRALVGLLLTTLAAACSPSAASLTGPSSPAYDDRAPYALNLGASPLTNGAATITIRVQNGGGVGLSGVAVTIATSGGSLDAATVTTAADGGASTTLHADASATITASVGALISHATVVAMAAPPTATPTPSPTPAPTPAPAPTPSTPLSLSLSVAPAIVGGGSIMSANVGGGMPPYQTHWTFGDGATFNGSSASAAHTYAVAGSYAVALTLTDSTGRSATANAVATVNPAPTPAPPATPDPALTLALSCTAGDHTAAATYCNVSANDETGAIVTTATAVTWDFGDGGIATTSTVLQSHQYHQPGTFVVFVKGSAFGRTGTATTTLSIK